MRKMKQISTLLSNQMDALHYAFPAGFWPTESGRFALWCDACSRRWWWSVSCSQSNDGFCKWLLQGYVHRWCFLLVMHIAISKLSCGHANTCSELWENKSKIVSYKSLPTVTCELNFKIFFSFVQIYETISIQTKWWYKLTYASFSGGMKEQDLMCIKLHGVNKIGLKKIIDFIYTAKLSLNMDNLQDTLEAASFLQILPVLDFCKVFLISGVRLNSCSTFTIIKTCHCSNHKNINYTEVKIKSVLTLFVFWIHRILILKFFLLTIMFSISLISILYHIKILLILKCVAVMA